MCKIISYITLTKSFERVVVWKFHAIPTNILCEKALALLYIGVNTV